MTSHRPTRRRLLALLALAVLAVLQAACVSDAAAPDEATAAAHILTSQPEMAATLTAWPTPPPLLTRPPTATPMPQPVWTAEAQPENLSSVQPAQGQGSGVPSSASVSVPGTRPPAVRLLIPRLGLDVPVVEVSWDVVFAAGTWQSAWQTADRAAGHHRNSANPGEAGNVVISGHHNTRGEVFRQVSDIGLPGAAIGPGDDVILIAQDGQQYTYTVVKWDRFQASGASEAEQRQHAAYLAPTADATLTLVTCWPYEGNTHRVVVVARLKP